MPPDDGDLPPDDDLGHPTTTFSLDPASVVLALAAVTVLIAFAEIVTTSSATVMVLVGLLLAFALDPVVDRIEARFQLRRGNAVAVVCGVALLLGAIVVVAFGPATVEQARSFQEDLPGVVDEVGSIPVLGSVLVDNDVPAKIEDFVSTLPRRLSGDISPITGAAEAVTTALLSAVAVGLVTVALLIDGPWLVGGVQRLLPPRRRTTADRLGRILGLVVGRYFAGTLLLATLQGLQVLVTGLALGVPLSPLLAVWAAVWNLVPQIGGAIGGVTFVAVALTQGPTTGLIAALVFMVYLTFANNVLLPVIVGRAVDISPLVTMTATIVGFTVGGVIGAMLSVPLVGAGRAVYIELRYPGRMEAEQEQPHAPGPVRRLWGRLRPDAPAAAT